MSDLVAELMQLNRAFATAEFAADAEFFRCHLADALLFRRASGKVVDKITFLKDLATPGNTNERLDAAEIEVLPCGDDLALCSVLIQFKGTRGGAAVDGVFRNTRVFVRREAVWRCALWFNTREP
jgi:hypothetical protein